ncbi:MAG: hypothetical protein ABIW33_04965 [Sphingomicrobium sp.]
MTSLSRKERLVSLILGLALNIAALVAIVAMREYSPARPKDAGTSLVSIAGQAKSVHARNLPTLKSFSPMVLSQPSFDPLSADERAMLGGSEDSCAILDSVAQAIVSDPEAVEAIIHAPLESRSIADAIVIWNADWSAASQQPDGPLETVRANVTTTLQLASPECLSSPVAGPRLVPIPNGDRTLFLVFGSGEWTWQALLEPDPTDFSMMPYLLG